MEWEREASNRAAKTVTVVVSVFRSFQGKDSSWSLNVRPWRRRRKGWGQAQGPAQAQLQQTQQRPRRLPRLPRLPHLSSNWTTSLNRWQHSLRKVLSRGKQCTLRHRHCCFTSRRHCQCVCGTASAAAAHHRHGYVPLSLFLSSSFTPLVHSIHPLHSPTPAPSFHSPTPLTDSTPPPPITAGTATSS